jgi:hypothetical protein
MARGNSPALHRRRFLSRPTSRAGKQAVLAALVAVAAISVSAGLTAAFERSDSLTLLYDVLRALRAAVIVVFGAAGVGALAFSLRGLRRGDRGVFVWAALAAGAAAVSLLIGEFTVLE